MGNLGDRLEALVNPARRFTFGRIMLDEQGPLDIIDQMPLSLPAEITHARRVLQEREQIINQAQTEADKILTMARDRAEYLLHDDGLINAAKAQAEQILADAHHERDLMRAEADNYAAEILTQLEDLLDKNLAVVRRGLEQLQQPPAGS